MRIYITRHGHVDYQGEDRWKGDLPLSATGRIQAELLGKELKVLGFHGPVFSSPYKRTIMTAQYIAEECQTDIYPDGALREFFFSNRAAQTFQGMNVRELRSGYRYIARDANLPYPWWEPVKDDYERIKRRSQAFWERILRENSGQILAVCHDASVLGAIHFFNHRFRLGFPCDFQELVDLVKDKDLNCELSRLDIDEEGKLILARFFMTGHLPEEYLTSNGSYLKRPDMICIEETTGIHSSSPADPLNRIQVLRK